MSALFTPLTLREVTFPNRVWMAPMCQYSADSEGDGVGAPHDWHRTHLVSRAIGGAGLILTEASAVSPEGRISPADLGIWNDTQTEAFADIVREIKSHGSVAGIQLAHAGRKASTTAPWVGGTSIPADEPLGWETVGPSAIAFGDHATPRAATVEDIAAIVRDFAAAAQRALRAGFEVVEIHAAHGYLVHQFLSPASNHRTDQYGGDFTGRIRILVEIVDAVRAVWPEELPLFVRVSGTDWLDEDTAGLEADSWTSDQTVALVQLLADHGVDLIDVSTGGNVQTRIPVEPGYQVPFAKRVQSETTVPAAAVGLITEPKQAEDIVSSGEAEAVLLARELLRDPYWPRRAARELGAEITPPVAPQYARAF
ncbi:NADH:flavin oxidoreductase/NADH oxidase [Rhodococcoides yunnanense]|uniref:NADH:flavin oxidoreductase/NADH oxidase n=1 Tax=Rhodococcoides yunnanense TaxID=278209 RepID=UPI000934D1AC|nr:NADH:flavin oxidoreductase/NADH oxidase [Rhodococcus yunnanensis]